MTTIWAQQALLPHGWASNVAVTFDEAGRISEVLAGAEQGHSQRVSILLPAPANSHSHAFQRAMAGLTERRGPNSTDSFWTWRDLMFRFLDRLSPEQVEAITAFVQMEMLEAGYATNVEFHYLHHQQGGAMYDNIAELSGRVVRAAQITGIGLTLLPVHYQYGGLDKRPLGPGQCRFGTDIDSFARLYKAAAEMVSHLPKDCQHGLAPHSLRAVDPENLNRLKQMTEGPFHMHLAEQVAEVEEVCAMLGKRPVEWVLDNLAPDTHMTFIHCTQMMPHETEALARSGAVAGLCPITESSLGDGIFDAVRWTENGGALSIGSDSNIRISLSEELRTLDYSQRLRDRTRAALATPDMSTGRRLYEETLKGGAQSAGRDTGAIRPGTWGDLLALDAQHVDLADLTGDTLLDSYIFAGDDTMVREVWSAGRHVVQNGRHIHRDQIEATYRTAMRTLKEAL